MVKIAYFKYRVFNLFIPILLCITSVVLISLSLAGSSVRNKTASSVYLMKLDLRLINYSSVLVPDNEALHFKSRLKYYYTPGLYSYCRTNLKFYDFSYFYCIKERKPAKTFNLYDVLEDEMFTSINREKIDYFRLPSGITVPAFFTRIIYAFFVLGITILSFTFVLYLLYACINKHQPHIIIPFLSLLSAICFAISGAIAHREYSKVVKAFKKQYDTFGIDASLGNKAFYSLIWATIAVQLVTFLLVITTNILLKRAKANEPPEPIVPVLKQPQPRRPTPSPPPIRQHTPPGTSHQQSQINEIYDEPPPRYEEVKNEVVSPKPNFFST